jgi:hypothetical protein
MFCVIFWDERWMDGWIVVKEEEDLDVGLGI